MGNSKEKCTHYRRHWRRTSPGPIRARFYGPIRAQCAGRDHLALMIARSAASVLRTASPRRVCSSVSRFLCAARTSSVSARLSASRVLRKIWSDT